MVNVGSARPIHGNRHLDVSASAALIIYFSVISVPFHIKNKTHKNPTLSKSPNIVDVKISHAKKVKYIVECDDCTFKAAEAIGFLWGFHETDS